MIRIIAVALIAFSLAGCAGKSVLQGGTNIFTPIDQPISRTNQAQIESAYIIVASPVRAFMNLRQCRRSETASLLNPCARRSIKVELQNADAKAYGALVAMRRFVRDYPQLSAINVIAAAGQAVQDLKNIAFIAGVK